MEEEIELEQKCRLYAEGEKEMVVKNNDSTKNGSIKNYKTH